MKQLSKRLTELIKQVEAGHGVLGRFFGQRDVRPALLDEIAASKELAAFPYLVRIWLESNELANDSLRAMSQLLATASAEEVLELEDELRRTWNWVFPAGWRRMQPSDVLRLLKGVESPTTALGVLSWHPNGRVREQAVRQLDLIRDGSEVPYLLIRLNDWVEAVRREARQSVLERLTHGQAALFFEHLYLVVRLIDCHRDDHSVVVTRVLQELTASKAEAKLTEALNSHSRYVRRTCYRLAMAIEGSHRSIIVRYCLRSGDAVLRLWASRDARQVLSVDELKRAVQVMSCDGFMPVRREALSILKEQFPDRALAALKEALLESGVSMREFARFHLRKLGIGNTVAFYRDAVMAGRKFPSAIAGLGEVGTAEDAELLIPFMRARSASVRAAATRAVGALAGDQNAHALLQMVLDDSKRVSLEAQRALNRRLEFVSTQDLANIFRTDRRLHVRWAVLRLLKKVDTWQAMPYLIEAAADEEIEIAEHVRRNILGRMNRVFTRPTPQERAAIDKRLDMVAERIPTFVDEYRKWLASRC
jgi:HEAT repeat protein